MSSPLTQVLSSRSAFYCIMCNISGGYRSLLIKPDWSSVHPESGEVDKMALVLEKRSIMHFAAGNGVSACQKDFERPGAAVLHRIDVDGVSELFKTY